eukprot:XP_011676924.1 PREDICTED: ankyrin-1-like [Strongylocentrotus purpuratus]
MTNYHSMANVTVVSSSSILVLSHLLSSSHPYPYFSILFSLFLLLFLLLIMVLLCYSLVEIQGADVNKNRRDGSAALHCCGIVGDLDVTTYLISQGAEVNKRANAGETALHIGAEWGHRDVTEYLISQGADVNSGDDNGQTALHVAAKNGHLNVTKYLISPGTDVNENTTDGGSALHRSAQQGHPDVSKYFINQGAEVNKSDNAGWTALHHAAECGNLDVTTYLISQGAEVNKSDNAGWTALHNAVECGNLDVTTYLIRQGAEVNKGDNEGWTPLHHAVQKGHIEVVEVLLAGGARFDIADIRGQTPLQLSLILGYQSIADYFIDRLNFKLDGTDFPYIHHATQNGHTSTIEKLVSKGADLNVQSTDGRTCLHEAIKLCYESGKSVQETDTLKEISDEYYNGELSDEKSLVFYLLENGAKSDVKDEGGNLPIHYAKDEEIKQMIFARIQSFEEIQSYRDEPSAPAIASGQVKGNASQEIKLEDHDVSLFIPPNAVHQNDSCKITITLLRDLPNVDIQNDESMACFGIRCEPPTMIFQQPVKIRIPLSSLVVNPDLVKPDIISREWDSVKKEEKKQQSYRKNHRSVPFSVESKSGDVTVTCHREGDQVESTVVSLKDVYGKMSHNVALSVTPSENDVEFQEFTVTITQAGRLEVSRSIAFIIRYKGSPLPRQLPSFAQSFTGSLCPNKALVDCSPNASQRSWWPVRTKFEVCVKKIKSLKFGRGHCHRATAQVAPTAQMSRTLSPLQRNNPYGTHWE